MGGVDISADVMVGAAAVEQVQTADFFFIDTAAGDQKASRYFFCYADIPAATRLSVRAQSGSTDATDRLFDAIVIGFG